MPPTPPPPWPHIHDLEMTEEYPAAIDALEARLAADPQDVEAVRRLGFNLWYAVVENGLLRHPVPAEAYATRFMKLYRQYAEPFAEDADFCWAFGLGLSLFPYYFTDPSDQESLRRLEDEGNRLVERAGVLNPMWAKIHSEGSDLARFKGRGIFESYYGAK
jgi:hypothetical protein